MERVRFVMKNQGLSDGHRRELEAEAGHLSGVGFLLRQKFLMERFLFRFLRRLDILPRLLDRRGKIPKGSL